MRINTKSKVWKKLIVIPAIILVGVITLKYISKPYVNSDTLLGRVSNILNTNNLLSLNCDGLDMNEVKIFWNSGNNNSKIIFSDSKQIGRIGHEYGHNNFEILLNNGLKFNLGHFKTNNWHAHKYKIGLIKEPQKYKVKLEATGPNSVNFEKHFDLNGTQIKKEN